MGSEWAFRCGGSSPNDGHDNLKRLQRTGNLGLGGILHYDPLLLLSTEDTLSSLSMSINMTTSKSPNNDTDGDDSERNHREDDGLLACTMHDSAHSTNERTQMKVPGTAAEVTIKPIARYCPSLPQK